MSCEKRLSESLRGKATHDKHKIANRVNTVAVGNISSSRIH